MSLISIVIITKNNSSDLSFTIESLEKQEKSKKCEVIIVNGGNKISSRKLSTLKKKFKFNMIEDNGKGIYSAMNLASNFASGKHILYLNAGDKLINKNILKNLLNLNLHEKYNYFFLCRVVGKYKKWIIPRHGRLIETGKRRVPVHQSIFFCKRFYKKNPYDEKMKIASDYAIKYLLLQEGKFKFIPYLISEHYLGGISSDYKFKNYIIAAKELIKIDIKYNRMIFMLINQFYLFSKFIIHNFLSNKILEIILSKHHSLNNYEIKT